MLYNVIVILQGCNNLVRDDGAATLRFFVDNALVVSIARCFAWNRDVAKGGGDNNAGKKDTSANTGISHAGARKS